MKRRKTVSVTPDMGARTVAGEIATFPILRDAGNTRAGVGLYSVGPGNGATGVSPVPAAAALALSQNFCTV
jgi:hypothetical protein